MGYIEDQELVQRRCVSEWSDKVTWKTLSTWIEQFDEEHRHYAVKMLKHFQFYSYGKVLQLMELVHTTYLKERMISSLFGIGEGTSEEREAAYRLELRKTLFLPVTIPEVPKSGDQMGYVYRQSNSVSQKLFTSVEHLISRITAETKYVVLIDDFLGTGAQALSFYDRYLRNQLAPHPNIKVFWVVGVALQDGISHVEGHTPAMIVAGEVLDSTAGAFSPGSIVFEELDSKEAERIIVQYGERLWPRYPIGWGHCGLLVGFHWCPPDNTVTSIWWPNDSTWTPVFRRPREEEQ